MVLGDLGLALGRRSSAIVLTLSLSVRGSLLEQHLAEIIGILTDWEPTLVITVLASGMVAVVIIHCL